MNRPYVKARSWTWKDADANQTPGVALMHGFSVKAHLTPDETRALADQLHDLADTTEQEPQKHDIGQQKKQSTPEGAGQ